MTPSTETIKALYTQETERFLKTHPHSIALSEKTKAHFLMGVPMHWMNDWSQPLQLFINQAQGATLNCADNLRYTDFCLGDTGAMFGHSPAPIAKALAEQANKGYTTMLPSVDAAEVGELLAHCFGFPFWQMALTASDANRFILRWARAVTGRRHIVVFNGCYHGTVDDVFVDLVDGKPTQRDSLLGQVYTLTDYTRVVEFNDIPALEAALADGQVACVITEPALTNIGMVLPDKGYLETMRALTARHGTLLIFDETHTISTGYGGYTQSPLYTSAQKPDMVVFGKPIAGGLPCAVYGFTAELAQRMKKAKLEAPAGHSGIGTTLSGNALGLATLKANLSQVITQDAYQGMINKAQVLADGLRAVIQKHHLAWCVTQIGARVEFQFCATPPKNGTMAGLAENPALSKALHLFMLNRGVIITPFHNMMLVCPATTDDDINRLLHVFEDGIKALQSH